MRFCRFAETQKHSSQLLFWQSDSAGVAGPEMQKRDAQAGSPVKAALLLRHTRELALARTSS